jgi:SMODS-associated and fused to various effectors sensor domain
VLKLEVSATITDGRIQAVLGTGVPIWSITAARPHNDALQRRQNLGAFRTPVRSPLI